MKWREYQQHPPSEQELEEWARRGLFHNIGIVCGKVSGDLVVLDFDVPLIYQDFAARFPGLAQSYTVATGGGGRHVYLYVSCLPPSQRSQKLELCANGRQIVAPPSVHPSTKQAYRVVLPQPILRAKAVDEVLEWMALVKHSPRCSPTVNSLEPPVRLSALVVTVSEYFRSLGYIQQSDWLKGPCIYPERHTHGDRRASFGFNFRTGYGNCFRCGSMLAKEIASQLGISIPNETRRPMNHQLHPAYKAGLAARNRLTDARDAVHRLREHLPEKRSELVELYNELCSIQGTLELLLEDVPTTINKDSP